MPSSNKQAPTLVSSEIMTLTSRYIFWLFTAAFAFGAVLWAADHQPQFAAIFSGVALLNFLWQWFFCRKIVFASFDDSGLHIKTLRQHESVPWPDVNSVEPVHWVRGRPYRISFNRPTTFGSYVYVVLPLSSARREVSLAAIRSQARPKSASLQPASH